MMDRRLFKVSIIVIIGLLIGGGLVQAGNKTVTDMVGREVQMPEKIDRIVTTYKPATQFIFALGVQEKLVAIDVGSPKVGLFTSLMPEIKSLPTVGSKRHGLNLEQIVAVNPDLVILFPYKDGPEVAKRLKKQGITSLIIKPENFKFIKETTQLLGSVINVEEQTARVLDRYDEIQNLVERTNDIPESKRKKVYFANSQLLNTVGKGMMQSSLIELAGGINPAAEAKSGFLTISPEQLVKWNPDTMILSQYCQCEKSKILETPEYQSIRAIKEGNIYRFPSEIEPWDFPSPSSYLGIIWLSKKLYPGKYEDINLDSLINNYYQTLYGRSFDQLN